MNTKLHYWLLSVVGAVVALVTFALVATAAQASEVTGDLTTGLTTGVGGTVIVAPTASPAAGTFTSTQSVTLTAAGSQSINFTTDGSTPTCTTGTVFSTAISVAA